MIIFRFVNILSSLIAYMALHSKTDYYKLCAFLFTGMTVFLIISTVYPNGQYLRPTYFAHHNLCTMLCERLYAGDTPTNLFPSIHVYNSLGIYLAVTHNKKLRKNKLVCLLTLILTISIILATMFIKQHSLHLHLLQSCTRSSTVTTGHVPKLPQHHQKRITIFL